MDLANQTIWDIKDAKARANILLCMKNIQLVHVKLLKTSKEIWDQIKTNFWTTNVVNKNYLTRKFYTLKLDERDIV